MTNDPLFAVRLVSDSPSWWAYAWQGITPLLGVGVGGWVTYIATVGAEKRREKVETYQLALSVAAEVKAGRLAFQVHSMTAAASGLQYAFDTLRYSRMPSDYLPISREAAKRAGRFVVPVAEELARYLLWMAGLKQAQEAIRRMHLEDVLTDVKLQERIASMVPMIKELLASAERLENLISQYYPA